MRFEAPFTTRDVLRADQVQPTPRMIANATFEGVRALQVFSGSYLRPLLQGLVGTTARERAITGLYYRMAAYLASVRKLDAPIHFQSIAAAARSVFEIALDIALLGADATGESVDRLAAFTHVERYRVARKLVDFYATRPLPPDLNITRQREICADPTEAAQVEGLVVEYWGRKRDGALNWPKHWSRFPDARGRAQQVGQKWEGRYAWHYYMLSWHIHSGIVGVTGLPQDVFDSFVADAHRLIQDSVIESYGVLGHELHLTQAMDQWANRLEFLQQVSGFALVDQRLQGLGEPARFLYLEEHERDVI